MERENGSCSQLRPSIFFRVQSLKCVITWGCRRGVRPCQRTRLRLRSPAFANQGRREPMGRHLTALFCSCLMISSCEEGAFNFFPPSLSFPFLCLAHLCKSVSAFSIKEEFLAQGKPLSSLEKGMLCKKSFVGSDCEDSSGLAACLQYVLSPVIPQIGVM